MPGNRPAGFRPRALRRQRATGTDSFGRAIFPDVLPLDEPPTPQWLSGRTRELIPLGVIHECALRKNARHLARFGFGVPQMGHDSFFVTGHKILRRPIFVIRDCGSCGAPGVLLVLRHHVHQLFVLSNASTGCFHRRDHALGIVHHPMMMICGVTALAAFTHQSRVRIGGADTHIINRLVTGPLGAVVELFLRRLIRCRAGGDQFGRTLHHRIFGRVGGDQAGIHMQFIASHQTRCHTLFHGANKQALEHLLAPAPPRFGKHAMAGYRIIQALAQKPRAVQPLRDDVDEFTLTGYVVIEEQEHHFHQDGRIH